MAKGIKGKYHVDLSEFSKLEDKDNWEVYKYQHYNSIKYNAKVRKIRFELDVEDLKYPDVCPILGIKITRKLTKSHVPTLDRVDNSRGYVKGNIQMISHKANLLKTNNSKETLEKILKYINGE